MSVVVEIAVEDLEGLVIAAHAGADRVELCTDLTRGGVTAPEPLIRAAAEKASALVQARDARSQFGVHALIRPRTGDEDFLTHPDDFVYTPEEVEQMAADAAAAVEAGAAGVVIGALTPEGRLDIPALERIRDAALAAAARTMRGVTLTCHRCVDAMADDDARVEAVTQLLALGMHRVLSSGGAPRAIDGTAGLARMVGAGEGICEVCAGGGIRPVDIAPIVHATGVADVHLSARLPGGPAGRDDGDEPQGDSEDQDAPIPRRSATDAAVATAAVDAAGAL